MTKETTTLPRKPLRETLIAAALDIVEREGEAALTMRGLASVVGVSLAAAYRHFADRADLLSAVVCEGYDDLLQRHDDSIGIQADPTEKLRRTMMSFIAFSRSRTGLFQLMFNRPVPEHAVPQAVREMEDAMYRRILDLVAPILPRLPEPELRLRTIALWATLLGHALGMQRHPLRSFVRQGLSDAQIDEHVVASAIAAMVT